MKTLLSMCCSRFCWNLFFAELNKVCVSALWHIKLQLISVSVSWSDCWRNSIPTGWDACSSRGQEKKRVKHIENSPVNWKNTYYLPFLCTRETKLRVFQFKFLHRRIATNDFLCKIGIKQVDSCSFCGETTETLAHLFWNCKHTQVFWKKLREWVPQNIVDLKDIFLSSSVCLGLVENVCNILLHHLLLIARHYIYSCKLQKVSPKMQVYLQLVSSSMKIEKKKKKKSCRQR